MPRSKIRSGEDTRKPSYLAVETRSMARKRREIEQEGHRRVLLAKVIPREHLDEEQSSAPEGELQNAIEQHPELDKQLYDGADVNLNPAPPLNSEARREWENKKRDQEKEKQLRMELRLGHTPSTPRPRPRPR